MSGDLEPVKPEPADHFGKILVAAVATIPWGGGVASLIDAYGPGVDRRQFDLLNRLVEEVESLNVSKERFEAVAERFETVSLTALAAAAKYNDPEKLELLALAAAGTLREETWTKAEDEALYLLSVVDALPPMAIKLLRQFDGTMRLKNSNGMRDLATLWVIDLGGCPIELDEARLPELFAALTNYGAIGLDHRPAAEPGDNPQMGPQGNSPTAYRTLFGHTLLAFLGG